MHKTELTYHIIYYYCAVLLPHEVGDLLVGAFLWSFSIFPTQEHLALTSLHHKTQRKVTSKYQHPTTNNQLSSESPILVTYRFGRICKCYMSLSKVPPPTAQMDHHKDLKFGMDSHLMPNRGATEAIFEKLPLSRAMGQGWGTPGGAKMSKKNFSIFFTFSTWLLRLVS